MDWISTNQEWVFSGVGVAVLAWIGNLLVFSKKSSNEASQNHIVINNSNRVHGDNPAVASSEPIGASCKKPTLESYKNETHILFIDDDTRFKVAKILVKSGWVHTKLVKDAVTLDDHDIVLADILFIDVQGVGVSLGFSDEGLGLALALKEKYPSKKVVIYSAETKGDRFHAALRKADSFLPKNADPYEFQKLVEDFTVGTKD